MLELARRVCLLREAEAHLEDCREVTDHDLDRELLLRQQRVTRAIHASHGTFTEERLDHVVLRDRRTDQRIGIGELENLAIHRATRERRAVDREARWAPANRCVGFER